jgi:hypothetical protein
VFTRDVLDGKRILVTEGGTGFGKDMGFAARRRPLSPERRTLHDLRIGQAGRK